MTGPICSSGRTVPPLTRQDGGLLLEPNAVGMCGLDTTHGVADLVAGVTDILSIESDWCGIGETR